MTNKPIGRKANIVVQEAESEILIYDLEINKAFCLNETSALIYQLCDGTNSPAEISTLLSKKFKTKIAEDFVWLGLDGLTKDNMLENGNELTNYFAGMSRREVIRKVGLASMVTLPLILSMIAPISVEAASINCSCVTPGDCISKTSCPSTLNCNPSMQCAP